MIPRGTHGTSGNSRRRIHVKRTRRGETETRYCRRSRKLILSAEGSLARRVGLFLLSNYTTHRLLECTEFRREGLALVYRIIIPGPWRAVSNVRFVAFSHCCKRAECVRAPPRQLSSGAPSRHSRTFILRYFNGMQLVDLTVLDLLV